MMMTRKRKNYQVCNDDNDDDERISLSYDNKVVVAVFVMNFQREEALMGNRCNKDVQKIFGAIWRVAL